MGLDTKIIKEVVARALIEDLGEPFFDKTSECLKLTGQASAGIVLKENAVVCGMELAKECFIQIGGNIEFDVKVTDGQVGPKGQSIVSVEGPASLILGAERTALNFLQRLSGIATLTRTFVNICNRYDVKVLDTRKTTPTMREIEKYAVACGGGINHRIGLYDQILIKDNHIKIHGIEKTLKRAIANCGPADILLEVDDLKQLGVGYAHGIRRFLLDNMSPELMNEARRSYPQVYLEASGGINLMNVEQVAVSGIDAVSVGALTHSPKAIDISLELL